LGSERIRTIRDLKGRAVAIPALDPSPYAFLASMVSYVGLNPNKDINWVKHRPGEAMQLLADSSDHCVVYSWNLPIQFWILDFGFSIIGSKSKLIQTFLLIDLLSVSVRIFVPNPKSKSGPADENPKSAYAFNSFFSSRKNRQSVPWAMSFLGLVLIIPMSCRLKA